LGYRGTGKSTLAQSLAKKLKRQVYDVDAMIVQSAGMSIPDIVSQWGWAKFREMESAVVKAVSEKTGIIDCGGGVVLDPRNIRHLRQSGKIVLLTAKFDAILERIQQDPNRPPLKNGLTFEEEQRRVLAERDPKYRAAADMICDTTAATPDETAEEIVRVFAEKSWL
ncbi:MAG: shikimate kinase, partial [Nitrospinales bacterium]